jgi:hypothetical protein
VKTRINQTKPNRTSDELGETLQDLTTDQIRFVVARQEFSTDKEAARAVRISAATVKYWKQEGAPIDLAVRQMATDGLIVAKELRRRNLAKAMAVKVKGLDSTDDKLRQSVATEVIEWEMGKATQRQEVKGEVNTTMRVIGGVDLDAV